MSDPRLTVVILAYNENANLRSVCQEILQTLETLAVTGVASEVLIVDDGSLDATSEALSGTTDPRVRLLSNTRGKGPAGARNTGLLQARGAYIAFLDSDDFFLPHHLDACLTALQKHESYALAFGRALYFQNGKEISYMGPNLVGKVSLIEPRRETADCVFFERPLFDAMLRHGCFFNISSVVMKRAVIDEGFLMDEDFANAADYEYWLRLSAFFRFLYLPSVQIHYFLSDDSMSFDNTTEKTARNFDELVALYRKAARYPFTQSAHKRIIRRAIAQEYFDYAYRQQRDRLFGKASCLYFRSFILRPSFRSLAAMVKNRLRGCTPAHVRNCPTSGHR